ncbi:MAG: hypothetical protein AAB702_02465 [Patescibacteria group bacterium]
MSVIKYSILACIILGFLFFYEINLALNAKQNLEKKVQGISTQIKEIEAYETEISNFNTQR